MMIPVVVSVASGLFVRTVHQRLAAVPIGARHIIPLDIVVVDEVTGRPIQGAWIDLPFIHPEWRARPDLQKLDLRRELAPAELSASPFTTNVGGRATVRTWARVERRIESYAFGFF